MFILPYTFCIPIVLLKWICLVHIQELAFRNDTSIILLPPLFVFSKYIFFLKNMYVLGKQLRQTKNRGSATESRRRRRGQPVDPTRQWLLGGLVSWTLPCRCASREERGRSPTTPQPLISDWLEVAVRGV